MMTLSPIFSFLYKILEEKLARAYETRRDDGSFCLLFIIFRFPHDVTVSRLLGCQRGGGGGEAEGVEGWSYLLTLPGPSESYLNSPYLTDNSI